MKADMLQAAQAYSGAAGGLGNIAGGAAGALPGATEAGGDGFASMLKDAAEGVVERGRATDQIMQSAAQGQGDMVNVVTAIAESELTVQTMVSVRDRVISAYQEIMNMPV
ncbi:MAG: flagellar hook-basal body complex protein FliE [Pseudomonadota bacterium]